MLNQDINNPFKAQNNGYSVYEMGISNANRKKMKTESKY